MLLFFFLNSIFTCIIIPETDIYFVQVSVRSKRFPWSLFLDRYREGGIRVLKSDFFSVHYWFCVSCISFKIFSFLLIGFFCFFFHVSLITEWSKRFNIQLGIKHHGHCTHLWLYWEGKVNWLGQLFMVSNSVKC